MKFIIKEWPDKSATLMTANGYTLSTFDTADEARQACRAWYAANGYGDSTSGRGGNQDPNCATCAVE